MSGAWPAPVVTVHSAPPIRTGRPSRSAWKERGSSPTARWYRAPRPSTNTR
jgi:hypothetical protein